MKTNSVLVQQTLKRAEAIQQLSLVSTEVLEILPAVVESLESIGFNPLATMQKIIEKATKHSETAKEAKHAKSSQ